MSRVLFLCSKSPAYESFRKWTFYQPIVENNRKVSKIIVRGKTDFVKVHLICYFFKPEVVINLGRIKLLPKQFLLLRKKCVNTIFCQFCADEDWEFDIITKYVGRYFDFVVSTYEELQTLYKKASIRVFFTQWAIGSDITIDGNKKKVYDVTFIGQPYGRRYEYIKSILESGVQIKVFGKNWNRYPDIKPNWGGFLEEKEFFRVITESKICINFSESSVDNNLLQLKARIFETCGCGTFLITNFDERLKKYYDIGNEIESFTNIKELIDKIKYYLKNEKEREIKAERAYLRTISEHTYNNRWNNFFNYLEENRKRFYKKQVNIPTNRFTVLYFYQRNFDIKSKSFKSIINQTVQTNQMQIICVGNEESRKIFYEGIEIELIKNEKDLKNVLMKKVNSNSEFIAICDDKTVANENRFEFQIFGFLYPNLNTRKVCISNYHLKDINITWGGLNYLAIRSDKEIVKNLNNAVIASTLMINKSYFINNIDCILNFIMRNNRKLIKQVVEEGNYFYIDLKLNVIKITINHLYDHFKLERNEANMLLERGFSIDNKKRILIYLITFKWINMLKIFLYKLKGKRYLIE